MILIYNEYKIIIFNSSHFLKYFTENFLYTRIVTWLNENSFILEF